MLNIAHLVKLQFMEGLSVKLLLTLPIAFFLFVNTEAKTSAQVVRDNTLPNNSRIVTKDNVIEITGGTTRGSNLFHSFREFSVLRGKTAFFNNALTIENIISRVTGGSISNIDGLIQANGSANLFLINSNGVIFGPNAALNIGGSFISSTAESIKFADGSEFSTTNPHSSPLLTVSIPVGLQYGANPGDILVRGPGNNLSIDRETFALIRDNRPPGLRVQSGKTLALVGGEVAIEGGNLTAEAGRIELGSVGGEGLVRLAHTNPGWRLNYEEIETFQNVRLAQAASLDVSGNRGGSVQVQGQHVTLSEGSAIIANILGDTPGGLLRVRGSESVKVIGTSTELPFYSGLFADVAPGATGDGGGLLIETGYLLVADGAQITSATFGTGNAGALTVKAQDVELVGASRQRQLGPSGLFAPVASVEGATGDSGNLTIEAERLLIADGAQVFTTTFGLGNAGNLTVKAEDIALIGGSPFGPSGFFTDVEESGRGDGGNLSIETGHLLITDGAQIGSGTFGRGDGGILTVKAVEIELSRGIPESPSAIFSNVDLLAKGNGGNLRIEAERLRLVDGAQVSTGTLGAGNAGSLIVQANEIELTSTAEQGASGLFAGAFFGTGNGGDLIINAERLAIRNGATISASNFSSRNPNIPPGQGAAGNLRIEARSIELDSTSSAPSNITASTNARGGGNITLSAQNSITARNNSQISAEALGSSNGGTINLTTNALRLTGGASLSTSTFGAGDAGNVDINANTIAINGSRNNASSSLLANVAPEAGGDGGNITIDADRLSILNGGEISVSGTGTGAAGNLNARSDLIELDNSASLRAEAQSGDRGNINLTANAVRLRNESNITTNATGSATGGNITINTDSLTAQNDSDITANAQDNFGGRVVINAEAIFGIQFQEQETSESDITASSELGAQFSGIVDINTPETESDFGLIDLPETAIDPSQLIARGCAADEGNVFVITGRGGLPDNPGQTLRGRSVWRDLRHLSRDNNQAVVPGQTSSREDEQRPSTSAIVEPQGWAINANGNVELLASPSKAAPKSSWHHPASCGGLER